MGSKLDADSHVQQVAAESQSRTEAALDKQLSQIGNAARLSTDGRTLILSRYTELNADQKMLVKQLNLDMPPQPPPRITAPGKPARLPTHAMEWRPSASRP